MVLLYVGIGLFALAVVFFSWSVGGQFEIGWKSVTVNLPRISLFSRWVVGVVSVIFAISSCAIIVVSLSSDITKVAAEFSVMLEKLRTDDSARLVATDVPAVVTVTTESGLATEPAPATPTSFLTPGSLLPPLRATLSIGDLFNLSDATSTPTPFVFILPPSLEGATLNTVVPTQYSVDISGYWTIEETPEEDYVFFTHTSGGLYDYSEFEYYTGILGVATPVELGYGTAEVSGYDISMEGRKSITGSQYRVSLRYISDAQTLIGTMRFYDVVTGSWDQVERPVTLVFYRQSE